MEEILNQLIYDAGTPRQLVGFKELPPTSELFKRTAYKFQITFTGDVSEEAVRDLSKEMLLRIQDFNDAVRAQIIDLDAVIISIVEDYLAKVLKTFTDLVTYILYGQLGLSELKALEGTIDIAKDLPYSLKAYSDKEIAKVCMQLNSALMDL